VNSFEHHLDLALSLSPNVELVHFPLGQTRFDRSDYIGALSEFDAAILSNPDYAPAKIARGACLVHLDREAEARQVFTSVAASSDILILNELARTMWEYKLFDGAISVLQKIVSLAPENADVHLNLAKSYIQNWNLSTAIDSLRKSLELNPDNDESNAMLADIYVRQGLSHKAFDIYEKQLEQQGFLSKAASSILFSMLYCDDKTVEFKFEYHRWLMTQWEDLLPALPTLTRKRTSERSQIRVGFVSADFRDQHPVGILVQSLFAHYDRSQFHFTCYYNSRTYDDSTRKIQSLVDQWTDVESWTDERLHQEIHADEVNILVDLSGHTAKNRLRLFSRRAAPVQVTWLGYPHSTGLSNMDYLIGDSVACPSSSDNLFTETLLPLQKHCVFCLPSEDIYGPVLPRPKNEPLVLGSFNNLSKVNPSVLALWTEVLLAIPTAHLKLKTPSFTDQECLSQVKAIFLDHGIEEERLIFSGPSGLVDMMQEYNQMDIALDTLPYNGGMTTLQALWMGVPVVAVRGENFCGRMGASILHHAGMADWIATDRGQFIEILKGKAKDLQTLRSFKAGLREQLINSAICDQVGYADEVSDLFQNVWQDYCDSNPD
jgi:predicted O-linked N-acetylglucosamine transferase (SPINDLY family)